MRQHITALLEAATEWVQADTVLKLIAADTAVLGDYARGLQDGYEEAQCVCVDADTWEDE